MLINIIQQLKLILRNEVLSEEVKVGGWLWMDLNLGGIPMINKVVNKS